MDEAQFLGYLVLSIITLGAFMLVIQRMTQPINDLKVVIQELRDCINSMKESNAARDERIEKLEETMHRLEATVSNILTKISLYHGNH